MGARRRTRQGLSIHVESVLGKGISMQIETVAKEGFLPVRVHPTDAGADLRADIPEPVTLQPRESTFFNTGSRSPSLMAISVRWRSAPALPASTV